MTFELDHLFIWTEPGAPAAQKLIDFGLTEGPSNIHPDQGTANRRFFFQNAMVELLWVHDANETRSELTLPTTLGSRYLNYGATASSFGLCLRPAALPSEEIPFAGWHYRPTYLPESLSVWLGDNVTQLAEPFLFYLSFAQRPDAKPMEQQPPLQHPIGVQEITSVRLQSPQLHNPSPMLQAVAALPDITIEPGEAECLEITFDQGQAGKSFNFAPDLPLVVCW